MSKALGLRVEKKEVVRMDAYIIIILIWLAVLTYFMRQSCYEIKLLWKYLRDLEGGVGLSKPVRKEVIRNE